MVPSHRSSTHQKSDTKLEYLWLPCRHAIAPPQPTSFFFFVTSLAGDLLMNLSGSKLVLPSSEEDATDTANHDALNRSGLIREVIFVFLVPGFCVCNSRRHTCTRKLPGQAFVPSLVQEARISSRLLFSTVTVLSASHGGQRSARRRCRTH